MQTQGGVVVMAFTRGLAGQLSQGCLSGLWKHHKQLKET